MKIIDEYVYVHFGIPLLFGIALLTATLTNLGFETTVIAAGAGSSIIVAWALFINPPATHPLQIQTE